MSTQWKVYNPLPKTTPGTSENINTTVAFGTTQEEAWLKAIESWAGVLPSRPDEYKRVMLGHGYRSMPERN